MNRFHCAMAASAAAFCATAFAQQRVEMNLIDIKGVGAPIGTVTIQQTSRGVSFTPALKGLPPGEHGFHVHEFGNCGAKEKDGKMSPGEMAGGHYDPKKTQKHAGPAGEGHAGDLPPLKVDAKGVANREVTTSRLTVNDLKGKTLMVHQGGDNFSDQPQPNGGGGARIACGVIPK